MWSSRPISKYTNRSQIDIIIICEQLFVQMVHSEIPSSEVKLCGLFDSGHSNTIPKSKDEVGQVQKWEPIGQLHHPPSHGPSHHHKKSLILFQLLTLYALCWQLEMATFCNEYFLQQYISMCWNQWDVQNSRLHIFIKQGFESGYGNTRCTISNKLIKKPAIGALVFNEYSSSTPVLQNLNFPVFRNELQCRLWWCRSNSVKFDQCIVVKVSHRS